MTTARPILTDKAPKPIGPYSQAVDTGSFLFISGQIPLDPATGQAVGEDVEAQAKVALGNLSAILASVGLTFGHLVKTTVFIRNMGDFARFNQVYEQMLGGAAPARSVVEVSALPRGVLVEIEAVAWR
ncbi:MAG: RidA family protein [Chitinispirillia bacterium]|nr:RidA family protein [Chitinispirillia bacterium]MCL2269239.1 RidA family protein [Chitinispirillia bacterium]